MLQIWNKLKLLMFVAFLASSLAMLNSAWAEDPVVRKHNSDDRFMHDLNKQGLSGNVYTKAWGDIEANLEHTRRTVLNTTGKVNVVHFTINQIKWELLDGVQVTQWAFNSQVPGPTIFTHEGDLVRIITKNNTTIDHTIHPHGMWLPVNMDGVPNVTQLSIQPGETFVYEFVAQPAGLHFYHCHVNAATHMDMGLYGALYVSPSVEQSAVFGKIIEKPFDKEYLFLVDEWDTRIDDGESFGLELGHPRMLADYNFFGINGKAFPEAPITYVREGDKVRVRWLNFGWWTHAMHMHGGAFGYRSAECDNCPQSVSYADSWPLQSAGRTDTFFIAGNPGRWVWHCHRVPHATNDGAYPGGLLTVVEYLNNPYLPVLPPLAIPGYKRMDLGPIDDMLGSNMSPAHQAIKKLVFGE
ncbi:MAG TPA: multicopper oxidase domain-containing protein [Nitrospinota bacterium]|nr:multicopper oxidase domain-containing protein [Nitrospinota bacterium]